jgi:hypothetical protein
VQNKQTLTSMFIKSYKNNIGLTINELMVKPYLTFCLNLFFFWCFVQEIILRIAQKIKLDNFNAELFRVCYI